MSDTCNHSWAKCSIGDKPHKCTRAANHQGSHICENLDWRGAPCGVRAANKPCACRPPKSHRDCAYCGVTSHSNEKICGICHEGGIDSDGVIRGTRRVTCALHKRA